MSTDLSALSVIQLRCFLTVVDVASFAGAGRRLGMTTSGVSKTVARLEAACGSRLLHRSTHALSPTEAGERLIAPARAVIAAMDDAGAALGELSGQAAGGRVRVSAPTAFVRSCLVPALPRLFAARPDIMLDIRASDTTIDLAEDGVDLALRSGPLDGLPGHVRTPWFSFPWVACASPDYLDREGTPQTPDDLRRHALIGFRNQRTGLVEPWRLRDHQTSGIAPSAWRVLLDDAEAAWAAALGGIGIAWAPRWLAAAALDAGTAVEVLRGWRSLETPMSIVRRDRRLVLDRVRAVIDLLVGEAPRWGDPGGSA